LKKKTASLINALTDPDYILTHREINELLSFPEMIREDSPVVKNISFFLQRPGGYYVLLLILLFNVKKIPCTIGTLNYYIPESICSKATMSNIIKEALQKSLIIKEDCRKDKRIKKIIPSKSLIDGWINLKNIFENDIGF
jgi:hypothetical protein|tara:strand:- start:52 stop:471 length:420 start_codon:yes stop_codon:yes gene_type:complete